MISDEEEDDKGDDIKDIEFRLSHDLDKLQVRIIDSCYTN